MAAAAQKLSFNDDIGLVKLSEDIASAASICNQLAEVTNDLDAGQFAAVVQLFLSNKEIQTIVACCIAMVVIPVRVANVTKATQQQIGAVPPADDSRRVEDATKALFDQLMPTIHARLSTITVAQRVRALRLSADIEDAVRSGVVTRLRRLYSAGSTALVYWLEAAKASASAWAFYEQLGGREELRSILARSAGFEVFLQHAAGAIPGYSKDDELKATVRSQTECIQNWMGKLQQAFPLAHVDFSMAAVPGMAFRLMAGDSNLYLSNGHAVVFDPGCDGKRPRGIASQQRVVASLKAVLPLTAHADAVDVAALTVEVFDWCSPTVLASACRTAGFVKDAEGDFMEWEPHTSNTFQQLLDVLGVHMPCAEVAAASCSAIEKHHAEATTSDDAHESDPLIDMSLHHKSVDDASVADSDAEPVISGAEVKRKREESTGLKIRPVPSVLLYTDASSGA